MKPIDALFLIPSFYGSMTWGITYALYKMKLVSWDDLPVAAEFLVLLTLIAYLAATAVSYMPFKQAAERYKDAGQRLTILGVGANNWWFWLLHLLGFAGISFYVIEVGLVLGGLESVFLTFVEAGYVIRQAEIASIGYQFAYFGWIAICITAMRASLSNIPFGLIAVAVVQYLGNFLFIDRTRPIWLLITAVLCALVVSTLFKPARDRTIKVNVKTVGYALLACLGIFVLIAEWLGKDADGIEIYGATDIFGPVRNVYLYLTTGFPYFGDTVAAGEPESLSLSRVLYPIYKAASEIGLTESPPSQVLEIAFVPFPTNVGTFLEPFFRDGGILLCLIGIAAYSIGLNALGYVFLQTPSPMAIFAWSNLCFCTFISFFVPKLSSAPIWLFVTFGIVAVTHGRSKWRAQKNSNGTTDPHLR